MALQCIVWNVARKPIIGFSEVLKCVHARRRIELMDPYCPICDEGRNLQIKTASKNSRRTNKICFIEAWFRQLFEINRSLPILWFSTYIILAAYVCYVLHCADPTIYFAAAARVLSSFSFPG